MRRHCATALLLVNLLFPTHDLSGQAGEPGSVLGPEPVATMSELMVHVLYPASDAIFYITTREPATSEEWSELQTKALMLAESANLLMLPHYARDQDQWMRDAKLLRDAGRAAFSAALNRDVPALARLNDQLYESCTSCHRNYRPNYGTPLPQR